MTEAAAVDADQTAGREPVIRVDDLALRYRIPTERFGTFKEWVIRVAQRKVGYRDLWALKGVSFDVWPGEVFAVIGPNGAGKSTLMKVLARILPPTKGRVLISGRVAPMIELGAGFNAELSGRENIVLYGTLLGRDPKEMGEQAEAIAEWAELTEFLDLPTRTYSSGMLARLGFAVATCERPEVLIIDEVLAVGDERFQRKSAERIDEFRDAGATVLLVSHALKTVEKMANRAMWLDRGEVIKMGDAPDVVEAYLASVD